ncbi:MAG TPA: hypothetical protein VFQ36_23295 [Ktedonobacteraceae bacterium]|nr:hypothetical protein [Ktedonobacteraceae bacterium]
MGVERAVTRWYVQRQALLYEIAELEAKLQPQSAGAQPSAKPELAILKRQIAEAQEKLRLMGSCPKPMMG